MSRCNYNSKRLIPCPWVEFTKTYQTTEDGEKIGSIWNIAINGRTLAFMGSPNSSGTFWTIGGFPPDENISENARLEALFRKQEAIRDLFSDDGYSLEFQSENGSAPIKCNPRINEINFVRDIWWNYTEYNVNAEADVLYINGQPYGEDTFSGYIETASDSWQIETDDGQPESVTMPRTYRLTHTISAKGKRFFNDSASLDKPAWQQARAWVLPRLGFDTSFVDSSGVRDLPAYYGGYNHVRSENIDELGGNYSVTESWVLASGTALENFDVSVRTAATTGLTNVSIEGTITGLEFRNNNMVLLSSKYDNAATKYIYASGQALVRAQNYSNTTLNIVPLTTIVGKNPAQGTITYTYEYDDRPSNIIPTSKSEVISINDSLGTDVVAIIPILGRAKGPILQNIGTSKERRRTLDVEIVVPPPSFADVSAALTTLKPSNNPATSTEIQSIIDAADPINTGATKSFLDDNNERWEPKEGRFSLTKTWVYEN